MKPRLYGTFGSLLIVLWGLRLSEGLLQKMVMLGLINHLGVVGALSNGALCCLTAAYFIFLGLTLGFGVFFSW
jgi:hypothetical protein